MEIVTCGDEVATWYSLNDRFKFSPNEEAANGGLFVWKWTCLYGIFVIVNGKKNFL